MRSYKSGASRAAFIVLGGLLASAALVQVLARRAEKAHRPLGKILRVRGRAVHVVERGTGPCVILLHGNGSMVEDFASTGLIDRLAENHRVLAFDRPGFGESDRDGRTWTPEREADLLAEVMQTLGVQTSVVVGHSWGGLVALSMALRDPDSITGLVLLSGYYYPTTRLDVAIQTPASLPVIGQLVRYTFWPLAARLCAPAAFKFLFSPMRVPAAFRKAYSVPMATRPCQLKSFADDTVTMPSAAGHICSRYDEIDVPIRLIAGVNDKVVSTREQSERLNRNLKDCELQLLEGVGHMSHHARPDLVVVAVDALSNAAKHQTPAALTLNDEKISA